MLLFLADLINIKNLRTSFHLFYYLSFLILLLFVAELYQLGVSQRAEKVRHIVIANIYD